MGTKQDVVEKLFKMCQEKNDCVFDNDMVKQVCGEQERGFGTPFDITKLDDTSKFPQILLDNDYFILHLGNGKHKFVKGINTGFHYFEEISDDNKLKWKYRNSLLNEFDTSESNILSVASNQRVIHDFLYEDIVASPKVYNARRTKMNLTYRIGNEEIKAQNLQMEIDLTMELGGVVTVFEGKNGFPDNFAVYQLFHPFKYYSTLKKEKKLNIKQITCCYVLRKREKESSILRLYNYTFDDENNIASIRLLKNAQYT